MNIHLTFANIYLQFVAKSLGTANVIKSQLYKHSLWYIEPSCQKFWPMATSPGAEILDSCARVQELVAISHAN